MLDYKGVFKAAGFTATQAAESSRKMRAVYTDAGRWALYDVTLSGIEASVEPGLD